MVLSMYEGLSGRPRNVRVTRCELFSVQLSWEASDDDDNDNSNDNFTNMAEYIVYYSDSSAVDPEHLVEGVRLPVHRQGSSPTITVGYTSTSS